jgi:MazG family protein
LMETLRAPGGCPWDQEQTHASLRRYVLEEAYEVVEAISLLPPNAPQGLDASEPLPAGYASLEDELGDLLSQVVFHATLAREVGAFTIDDVIRGIHAKLVRRHPHVFGDVEADTGDDVMRNWEQIKKVEKGTSSIVEGITPDLPSLLYSLKLLRKAASVGLVVDDVSAAHEQAAASLEALVASPRADAAGGEQVDEIVGELLAAMVVIARARGVDAESALRGWSARYRDHFVRMEGLAAERELDLAALSPDAVAALWADAGD